MSAKPPSVPSQTVVERILDVLVEGKQVQVRHRKSEIQQEYMVARRMLQDTYSQFSPEDLPVDLQRIRRDLEIWRDQRIGDAVAEIEQAYSTARSVIKKMADGQPGVYQTGSKKGDVRPAAPVAPSLLPPKIAKYLSGSDMCAIARAVLGAKEGLTLVRICDELSLSSPPAHLATKRFLAWMRSKGHIKTVGPGGKGMRYVATSTLAELIGKLAA